MPKVSVIIATHSRPQLLLRAVESAFKAGTDVEVIVIDDASTDETAEICQKTKDIKYIRAERNQKTAGARNLGILASTAPYIAFLDDDDWRLPDSLDWQVSLLDENPEYGLIYGKYALADQEGNVLDELPIPSEMPQGDIFYRFFEGNPIGCLTAVFRKKCIYKIGMLDPRYNGIDDWDLWLRIAELYPILAIERPVAVWRKPVPRSGQGSSDYGKLFRLAIKAYDEKWSQLPRARERAGLIAESKKTLCRLTADAVIYKAGQGNTKRIDKLRYYYEAVKIYPQIVARLAFYKIFAKNIFLDK